MITDKNFLASHRGTQTQSKASSLSRHVQLQPGLIGIRVVVFGLERDRVRVRVGDRGLEILEIIVSSLREARGEPCRKYWLSTLMLVSSVERWDTRGGNVLDF